GLPRGDGPPRQQGSPCLGRALRRRDAIPARDGHGRRHVAPLSAAPRAGHALPADRDDVRRPRRVAQPRAAAGARLRLAERVVRRRGGGAMMDAQFWKATAITFVYAMVALVLGVVAVRWIDRRIYTEIDFIEEIKRGNLAAAIYASVLLLFVG